MRLPPFLTEKPLIGAVLDASDAGAALLEADVDRRNDQLSYRTADEGLRRWERDLSLPSDGDLPTRRARVYAALTGGRTLTVEELEKLALTLSGAQEAVVTEKFNRYQVVLSALFDGEAGDLTALRAAVERRKPAHLDIRVQSTLPKEQVVYYGLATPLSAAGDYGGVTMARHALFANTKAANAYDAQLVRVVTNGTFAGNNDQPFAKAGEYAIATAGANNNCGTAYDDELVRSHLPSFIGNRYCIDAASTENHAIFGAGMENWPYFVNTVNAFDSDLVMTTITPFREAKGYYVACSKNGYAVFFGGVPDHSTSPFSTSKTVDAYDSDLQKLQITDLAVSRWAPGAASAGEYIVVAGGRDNNYTNLADVDAYAADFTRITMEASPISRSYSINLSFAGNAIFAGGGGANGGLKTVICYDADLTRSTLPDLAEAKSTDLGLSGCAVIGDFGLIAGGAQEEQRFDTVEVYTLE